MVSSRPLVSILIPAYNAERWIADTLRSALGQTWPDTEIIVVDDGSRDGTLAVARQFESRKVKVITQTNQGAAAARNKALALSQGDYIQWLDADDLLAPNKIVQQMEAANKSGNKRTLFSSPWGSFRYRPGKAQFTQTLLWCDLDPIEWLTRKWEGNLHMQTATWLVSRELTTAAGPWDTRLMGDDDGEYFFRVINASNSIRFVAEGGVYYRITESSRLSDISRSNKKIEAQFLGMEVQIEYLLARKDDERIRAACITYLQNWLPNFYPNRPDLVEKAQQLANRLGGQLRLPQADWKYAWIEKLFGFNAAKHAQLYYNRSKSWMLRGWDRMLYNVENRRGLT